MNNSPSSPLPARTAERFYLPGLNALRFYAAMSVVVVHIRHNFAELRSQPAHYPLLEALVLDAQSAVTLFFVLSGFLITLLLCKEQASTGTIAVRAFYLRRILRIWPLYYLITLAGFWLLPRLLGPAYPLFQPPLPTVALVMVMLPNFVTPLGPIEHLWSIGLEEQFYLVWPRIVKKQATFLRVILGIILVKVMIAPAIWLLNSPGSTNLLLGLRFESMAIGALGAYLYHHNHSLLPLLHSKGSKYLAGAGLIYLALVDIPFNLVTSLATSCLFMLLILNLSTNSKIGQRLEIPLLRSLGKISYGIYMFHYPLLYLILFTMHKFQWVESPQTKLILYVATIGGTLLLAALSYRYYELPFLNLKERYAIIHSRR